MQIEYATPTLLKITWPLHDSAIEGEIRRRLATVPGVEVGHGRRCYAPMIQLSRLIELFPKSSIGYDALVAADATAQTFWESLVRMGINIKIDESGAVVAFGDNVSPVLQTLIDDRADALRPLVLARGSGKTRPRPPAQPVQGPQTAEVARLEPLLKGIQNAKAKEEANQFKYPKRRKPRKGKSHANA